VARWPWRTDFPFQQVDEICLSILQRFKLGRAPGAPEGWLWLRRHHSSRHSRLLPVTP
jgi:hypothetical protein